MPLRLGAALLRHVHGQAERARRQRAQQAALAPTPSASELADAAAAAEAARALAVESRDAQELLQRQLQAEEGRAEALQVQLGEAQVALASATSAARASEEAWQQRAAAWEAERGELVAEAEAGYQSLYTALADKASTTISKLREEVGWQAGEAGRAGWQAGECSLLAAAASCASLARSQPMRHPSPPP
jgi:hypothetical protein